MPSDPWPGSCCRGLGTCCCRIQVANHVLNELHRCQGPWPGSYCQFVRICCNIQVLVSQLLLSHSHLRARGRSCVGMHVSGQCCTPQAAEETRAEHVPVGSLADSKAHISRWLWDARHLCRQSSSSAAKPEPPLRLAAWRLHSLQLRKLRAVMSKSGKYPVHVIA